MVMTDHIADAFFAETLHASMTLRRRYNIRQFDADAILLREIQCKKAILQCLSDVFSAVLIG